MSLSLAQREPQSAPHSFAGIHRPPFFSFFLSFILSSFFATHFISRCADVIPCNYPCVVFAYSERNSEQEQKFFQLLCSLPIAPFPFPELETDAAAASAAAPVRCGPYRLELRQLPAPVYPRLAGSQSEHFDAQSPHLRVCVLFAVAE